MKITDDRFEISSSESIPWEDVKTLRLLNEKLALVLNDGRIIELSNLRSSTIDMAFRAYERYLKDHPEKRKR
jgi:hypothetical protein